MDIRAEGFWERSQDAFFDMWVLTHSHRATAPRVSMPPIKATKKRNNETMSSESEKWNMGRSPPLSFLQLVEWERRVKSPSRDWRQCYHASVTNPTAQQRTQSDV